GNLEPSPKALIVKRLTWALVHDERGSRQTAWSERHANLFEWTSRNEQTIGARDKKCLTILKTKH
ncbi:MAG TPA: hypothetical protein VF493_00375, partial [Terriglobales bacterium]